jgi:hypothetical protein
MTLRLSLRPGQTFIENSMIDNCSITRDVQQNQEDLLDVTTGTLIKPTDATTTIYTGKCIFKRPARTLPAVVGGETVDEPDYKVLLPKDSPVPRIRDVVTCNASVNDDYLVGRVFRVLDTEGGSYQTYRSAYVKDITTDPIGV